MPLLSPCAASPAGKTTTAHLPTLSIRTSTASIMSKVAIVAGYGPGISSAFAKKFGSAGFNLALLSRTQAKVDAAATELSQTGVTAKGYSVDLADAGAVQAAVATIQKDLGPIDVLFWNPVGAAAPFQKATPEQTMGAYNVTVTGLIAAVQAAQADLRTNKGAILVTGGSLALENDTSTGIAVDWGATTLAVSKAAQRKLVHILHKDLAREDIYVAEVTVAATVRGTGFDKEGKSPLTAEAVADTFYDLYTKRDPSVWFVMKAE